MSMPRHILLLSACAALAVVAASANAGDRRHARDDEKPRREEAPPPRVDRDQPRRPPKDRSDDDKRGKMTPMAAPWRDADRDQGEFKRCGAMPYSSMRNGVEAQFQGRIVGQQFLSQQCQYRLKVLRPSGQVLAVSVDAQSGSVLGVSGDE